MTERPILFQGAMVRAILDGSKTQTRRVSGLDVINAAPARFDYLGVVSGPGEPHHAFHDRTTGAQTLVRCRSGQPGDRLWVREAWARTAVSGSELVVYREGDNRTDYGGPWKPGIHMFRRDCRLILEVTGVRVESLQDISEADAIAEGIEADVQPGDQARLWRNYATGGTTISPIYSYQTLWELINGAGSWTLNPWVWVVSFRRL